MRLQTTMHTHMRTHLLLTFNFDDHVLVDTGMHHQSNESILTTLSLPVYTNVRIMNWHRRHGGSTGADPGFSEGGV